MYPIQDRIRGKVLPMHLLSSVYIFPHRSYHLKCRDLGYER